MAAAASAMLVVVDARTATSASSAGDSAHFRSLQATIRSTCSTDQHTVKPGSMAGSTWHRRHRSRWARLHLIGGRFDFIDGKSVAVTFIASRARDQHS
jgi:hypothetical protein